jgi:hypothetical protein
MDFLDELMNLREDRENVEETNEYDKEHPL